jgi:hypothetical protein
MASIIMMMAGVFPTPGQPRNMKAKFMNSGYRSGSSLVAKKGLKENVCKGKSDSN